MVINVSFRFSSHQNFRMFFSENRHILVLSSIRVLNNIEGCLIIIKINFFFFGFVARFALIIFMDNRHLKYIAVNVAYQCFFLLANFLRQILTY
jgi:hypothetical protein